mgnify:CR=1 FL=1
MVSSTFSTGPGGEVPRGDGRGGPYDGITEERASTLLRMGLHGPRNAADDLVDELEQCDGARWLESQFRRAPFAELPRVSAALLNGEAGVDAMKALKERAKEIVKKPASREAYLAGLAAYYLAIAAALVHHRTRITRQSAHELEHVLQELAAVTPLPWSELLANGATAAKTA